MEFPPGQGPPHIPPSGPGGMPPGAPPAGLPPGVAACIPSSGMPPGGPPNLPVGGPTSVSQIQLPDFSKPPPGFLPGFPGSGGMPGQMPGPIPQQPLPTEADLTPTVPYFELPAGLMAPLVKVCTYMYWYELLKYIILP